MSDTPDMTTDYERGRRDGAAERIKNFDPTWHPGGAWSDYERGWNAGYNGEATDGSV